MEGLFNSIVIFCTTLLAWQGGLILLCVFFWLLSIAARRLKLV